MTWIDALVIVAVVGVLALSLFVIVPWRLRRAMKQIVNTSRKLNATNPATAVTAEELGIRHHSFFVPHLRDYKPQALDILVKSGALVATEDNKLYLNEERLRETGLVPAK